VGIANPFDFLRGRKDRRNALQTVAQSDLAYPRTCDGNAFFSPGAVGKSSHARGADGRLGIAGDEPFELVDIETRVFAARDDRRPAGFAVAHFDARIRGRVSRVLA
jgi:hypothetical protein